MRNALDLDAQVVAPHRLDKHRLIDIRLADDTGIPVRHLGGEPVPVARCIKQSLRFSHIIVPVRRRIAQLCRFAETPGFHRPGERLVFLALASARRIPQGLPVDGHAQRLPNPVVIEGRLVNPHDHVIARVEMFKSMRLGAGCGHLIALFGRVPVCHIDVAGCEVGVPFREVRGP
jgi:hypothetical protein